MLESLIENVRLWCSEHKDIVGLALVGSYANGTQSENSDVDFVVLSNSKKLLLQDQNWLQLFGEIKSIEKEYYGKVTSLRAEYELLPEIEFGITDLSWVELPLDQGTRDVMSDGISVIYDPKGLLNKAICASSE